MSLEVLAFGANALASGIGIGAERRRAEKRAAILRRQADIAGARRTQEEFGQGETLGALERGATRGTLEGLASRGVLESDFAAPEVAQAVAPFELERLRRLDESSVEEQRLRAAAELETTNAPGFGDFMGGLIGDASDYLGYEAGRKRALKDRKEFLRDYFEMMRSSSGGMDQYSNEAPRDRGMAQ